MAASESIAVSPVLLFAVSSVCYDPTRHDITRCVIARLPVENELAELGRFSEPGLLILVSLSGGAKHGYAIMDDIEGLRGVRLGPGTLYGALARLERRGLIEPLAADDRRRPYQLTGRGAAV